MTDDGFVLERDRHSLNRDVEVFRRGKKHSAGFLVTVLLARRARKRMTRDAIIAVGFQKSRLRRRGVARPFGGLGPLFPLRAQRIPGRSPALAFEIRHLREGAFRFLAVGVEKWRALTDALANIVFHFVDGTRLAHETIPQRSEQLSNAESIPRSIRARFHGDAISAFWG